MEWKSLSILATIYHLTICGGLINANTASSARKPQAVSVVTCHQDQPYFCLNITHYSPCVHLDLENLSNASSILFSRREFYCGAHRCCRVGANSPCTYRCQYQTSEFRKPWNYQQLAKNKKEHHRAPLTNEEVNRLNKIVSIKNFIIRQKDLEGWDNEYYDDEFDDNIYKWQPSYRTFCPLKQRSIKALTVGMPTYPNAITRNISTTSTSKPIYHTTVTSAKRSTMKLTTPSTTKRSTAKTVTTKTTTKTTFTTIKATTTRTRRTRPTKVAKKRNRTRRRSVYAPRMRCTARIVRRKHSIPGTCQDYFECVQKKNRRGDLLHRWTRQSCPPQQYFDMKHQLCMPIELVKCDVTSSNDEKLNRYRKRRPRYY